MRQQLLLLLLASVCVTGRRHRDGIKLGADGRHFNLSAKCQAEKDAIPAAERRDGQDGGVGFERSVVELLASSDLLPLPSFWALNTRLGDVLRRARDDANFTMRLVVWSSSVGLGPWVGHCLERTPTGLLKNLRGCALERYYRSQRPWQRSYLAGPVADTGCGWPGRLAMLMERLLPRRNYRVLNLARHGQNW